MTFRADGTSVVEVDAGRTSGVALAFDPDMARHIAEALNKHLPGAGGRGKVDPLTGKQVDRLDVNDATPLSDVLGKGEHVRIVGPYATAMMGTPDGQQVRALNTGAQLPGDVSAGQARHLIDVGLAELVKGEPARDAGDGTENGPTTPAGDAKPTSRSTKEEWVAYAVTQRPEGMSEEEAREQAEATSKNELMATYGNGNGS